MYICASCSQTREVYVAIDSVRRLLHIKSSYKWISILKSTQFYRKGRLDQHGELGVVQAIPCLSESGKPISKRLQKRALVLLRGDLHWEMLQLESTRENEISINSQKGYLLGKQKEGATESQSIYSNYSFGRHVETEGYFVKLTE